MESERVVVEIVALEDLGAQARGLGVFGVKIGDNHHLSFEVPPETEHVAATYVLIGVMEGLRHTGTVAEWRIGMDTEVSVIAYPDGPIGVKKGAVEVTFDKWAPATARVVELTAVD